MDSSRCAGVVVACLPGRVVTVNTDFHRDLGQYAAKFRSATLYDEKRAQMEKIFINTSEISLGNELEFPCYLVQIETLANANQSWTSSEPTVLAKRTSRTSQPTLPVNPKTGGSLLTRNDCKVPSNLRVGMRKPKRALVLPLSSTAMASQASPHAPPDVQAWDRDEVVRDRRPEDKYSSRRTAPAQQHVEVRSAVEGSGHGHSSVSGVNEPHPPNPLSYHPAPQPTPLFPHQRPPYSGRETGQSRDFLDTADSRTDDAGSAGGSLTPPPPKAKLFSAWQDETSPSSPPGDVRKMENIDLDHSPTRRDCSQRRMECAIPEAFQLFDQSSNTNLDNLDDLRSSLEMGKNLFKAAVITQPPILPAKPSLVRLANFFAPKPSISNPPAIAQPSSHSHSVRTGAQAMKRPLESAFSTLNSPDKRQRQSRISSEDKDHSTVYSSGEDAQSQRTELVPGNHKPPGAVRLKVAFVADQLRFPDAVESGKTRGKRLQRSAIIPSTFPKPSQMGVHEYQTVFTRAVNESLQVQLSSLATQYYAAMARKLNSSHATSVDRYFGACGVPLYSNSMLTVTQIGDKNLNVILTLPRKEPSSAYSKGDIWIVSRDDSFRTSFLATSNFFGPTTNLTVELIPISDSDKRIAKQLSGNVLAIRGPNASTEQLVIENLATNLSKLPMMPLLLNYKGDRQKSANGSLAGLQVPIRKALLKVDVLSKYHELVESVIGEFKLNQDQGRVVRDFANSVMAPNSNSILLVHGVFGGGKRVLDENLVADPERFKIQLSSHTNVAVDNVLLNLLELGFKSFVRVGSRKKMARKVLPYSCGQSANSQEEVRELSAMLQEELSEEERADIQLTIERLRSTTSEASLKTALVIATTCISSSSELLEGVKTPIVILDGG
ncbi:hypothetical protein HDU93_009572 [Gonapodya sp. JEL0774]|nr:hypothetical protein HDU93_009572 [Gonapodya sp. JEL0774]